MNKKLDAESYLKSGSNELRVLEYQACGMAFGINILKVNKIVSELKDFTRVPESHPAVKGVFKDMGRLVPVVDLPAFLGIQATEEDLRKVIITEFFGILTGFWASRIDWIHHFKWADVIDAEEVFAGIDHKYTIGIVKPTEERMVQLLDYETILLDLCPHLGVQNIAERTTDVTLTGKNRRFFRFFSMPRLTLGANFGTIRHSPCGRRARPAGRKSTSRSGRRRGR